MMSVRTRRWGTKC